MLAGIRRELKPMIGLAVPVVLAEVGWTTMGLVDTLMVGSLGPAAIGAVGLGSIVFLAIGVFGMGLLLGLDTLVSQAYGAGRLDRCHHWLLQSMYLALVAAIPLTLFSFGIIATMPFWGLNLDVLAMASPYLKVVSLSVLPLLFYTAFRRYLQAMNSVRPITVALVTANLVNVTVNWVLIHGHLGFPALGATGAAWATVLSRIYMAAVLLVAIVVRDGRYRTGLAMVSRRIEWPAIGRMLGLGVPAGLQILLEVGVFAAVSALAGQLSSAALAAHQIALNLWAFVFMVPLGLNAAGAVRVGHAVGRGDAGGVWCAGWTALALGASFTATSALVFLVAGRPLISAFSRCDRACHWPGSVGHRGCVPDLRRDAGHFDGDSSRSRRNTGADADEPGWSLGDRPAAGYVACFWWGRGVQGLWLGLAVGLVIVGVVLIRTWHQRAKHAAFHNLPVVTPA